MKNLKIFSQFSICFLGLIMMFSSCTLPQKENIQNYNQMEEFPVSEFPASNLPIIPDDKEYVSHSEMRGVWISYLEFDHMLCGESQETFETNIIEVVQQCKKQNLNTLFVQVRSHGDAYYPSEYFPWSSHASGDVGKACDFDPLKIIIEQAKKENISVHAWINPYRLMKDDEMQQLSDQFSIKKWYQNKKYMAQGEDGNWYLNAGNKEVQQLILKGVEELVCNYEIDGVQIDDYFYDKVKPKDFGETEKQGRSNITNMVKQIYNCVKKENMDLQFGVSPAGNYRDIPVSDENQLTDLQLWCTQEGYVDYIAPQIYWDFEDEEAPFLDVLKKWETLVTKSEVKLYVGLAAYKFAGTDILLEEIRTIEEREQSQGYVLFRYDNLV